ncbi:tail fiber domain-containing protein [uncultured Psychroserpens sp.]|uniref:tail fiber domain-containing protein n=1 Tax=uncultured Psychroserpens sp. TaxID=255436 RepID=UPI00261DADA4|nr:tail fiber domain-containing protein [uncultured Psychroserpens sp.]
MKKTLLFITLLSAYLMFGQATTNQSVGTVNSSITNPTGPQASEIFRFRAGNVTQLDDGSNFTFNNSRWFALGRVPTGSQSVYGLRFQIPNKSLTFGYQNINNANDKPRIQWIGSDASSNDLEFRVANSFTSTNSTLVATMDNEGSTTFGRVRSIGAFSSLARVEIDNISRGGLKGSTATGLKINSDPISKSNTCRGIDITSNAGNIFNIGGNILTQGPNSTGLNLQTSGTNRSIGISSRVTSGSNEKIAVFGSTFLTSGFDAAIYGEVSLGGSNSFAGYFDGNVFTTGSYLPSDRKLKENVKEETNVLERLALLRPITYDYKIMSEISLSDKKQHGFISQEFAEVFPELTLDITKPVFDKEGNTTSKFSFKSINYTGMISILTAAVNELNDEVKLLKEELAELKGQKLSKESNNELSTENSTGAQLEQNIPNPFTDRTTIRYQLQEGASDASLMVFDMNGRIVREFKLSNKSGEITINASQIGKGMFIYSLVLNGQELISKRMIIK